MAKRKKTEETVQENTPSIDSTDKHEQLIQAAQDMINLYKLGHTIINYNSYKYPGLREVAIALDNLK